MPNPAVAYESIIAAVLAAAPARAGGVEAALAQVIAGAVAPPGPAEEFPFPADAAIRAELTPARANWPVVIKRHLDDFVLPQFQAIPATAVPGAPGGASVAWNTEAQIDKIVRHESQVTFTVPPTNALPNAMFSRFDFKLRQLQPQPGDDIVNGWQLVKAYSNPASSNIPASAHSSERVAMQTIKNLAAFEGFCIRLAIAIGAAARAGVSLSETFALWRTEGDLLTPYSEQRRLAGAPTCDVIPKISLGTQTQEVFFSMKRGLWTFTFNLLYPAGGLPASPPDTTRVQNAFKLLAFSHWSLVAAGVDFFWKVIRPDVKDRATTVPKIAAFLNANHVARLQPDDLAARVADCNAVLDDLQCTLPADPAQRVVVAPRSPSKLLSLMLGEALIFAELDTAAGKGPLIPPTAKLKYLAYHCQDHRHPTDATQDKFTLMLVSAAVAAARGPAGALKTSLAPFAADPLFPRSSDLKRVEFKTPAVTGDASGHLAGYRQLQAAGWWNATNLDNLADWVLIASDTQWQGWEDLRGNVARYRKLRAYYDALLS
jgi:hypothetical protein